MQLYLILGKHLVLLFVLIYADCTKPYIKAMLIYTTNGKTLIMADSIKLLCALGLVSVRSVIHINYSIWFFHMTLGKIKKSFMWELVFMVAILSRNYLIFVSFYPNILENVYVNAR